MTFSHFWDFYPIILEFGFFKNIVNILISLVLGRAIHSLAKIGEDLYLDPTDEGLALRTVNSSRSAFVSYSFKTSFFSSFTPKTTNGNDTRPDLYRSSSQQNNQEGTNTNDIIAGEEDSKCRVTMRVNITITIWNSGEFFPDATYNLLYF